MNITVLGLGNVGLVVAVGLCELGHNVLGIEINKEKVKLLEAGNFYVKEPGLKELFEKNSNKIIFSNEMDLLVDSEVIIICVGTPAKIDGEVYLGQVRETFEKLKKYNLSKKTIILRSTIPPGTIDQIVKPILAEKFNELDFIYHPEFLREGSAVEDFLSPNIHVVGLEKKIDLTRFNFISNASALKIVTYKTGEMIKYLNNSFHALKVSYVNEIASIASKYGVRVDELFECFLADKKLNISEKYLKPGFAFGGPCLTKDVTALMHLADRKTLKTPMIDSIIESNDIHIKRIVKKITDINPKNILFVGVTFKPNTNDLRSSPILKMISMLNDVPSYVPKKEIYIRDSQVDSKDVLKEVDAKLVGNIVDIKFVDLIILGPYGLDNSELKNLNELGGLVLDLGYGANDLNMISGVKSIYD